MIVTLKLEYISRSDKISISTATTENGMCMSYMFVIVEYMALLGILIFKVIAVFIVSRLF